MKRSLIKLINGMTGSYEFDKPRINNYLTKNPNFVLDVSLIEEIKNLDCKIDKKVLFYDALLNSEYTYSITSNLCALIIITLVYDEGVNNIAYKRFLDENSLINLLRFYGSVIDAKFSVFMLIEENKNFTEVLTEIVEKYSASNSLSKNVQERFENLKVKAVRENVFDFARNIYRLEGKDLEEFYEVNYNFGKYDLNDKTLLHLLVEKKVLSEEKLINIISKLLYLGVDPSKKDRVDGDFLCIAVAHKYSSYFLKEIIKLSAQYNFIPDETIFYELLDNQNSYVLEIYKLLCEHGFTLFDQEFNSYSYEDEFVFDTEWGSANYSEAVELSSLTRNQCIVTDVINSLKKTYKLEENFKEKINFDDYSIYPLIEHVYTLTDELWENFSETWVNAITKNRNNSVNVLKDEITVEEAIDALKILLFDFTEQISNNLDEQKTKIIAYKK